MEKCGARARGASAARRRGASQEEELYGKETWKVNKICQETVMKTEWGAATRSSTGNSRVQDEGILKQSRQEIRCWCLTFTVSGNRGALTEDVELEDGLRLAHHVLGAAYEQPAVVVGREVGQGEREAGLRLRVLDLETSTRPRVRESRPSSQEARRSQRGLSSISNGAPSHPNLLDSFTVVDIFFSSDTATILFNPKYCQ